MVGVFGPHEENLGAVVIPNRPAKKRVRHADRRGHALRQPRRTGVYTDQMNGDAGSGGPVIDQLETNGCDDPSFTAKHRCAPTMSLPSQVTYTFSRTSPANA